jgi:hypothetical protein
MKSPTSYFCFRALTTCGTTSSAPFSLPPSFVSWYVARCMCSARARASFAHVPIALRKTDLSLDQEKEEAGVAEVDSGSWEESCKRRQWESYSSAAPPSAHNIT